MTVALALFLDEVLDHVLAATAIGARVAHPADFVDGASTFPGTLADGFVGDAAAKTDVHGVLILIMTFISPPVNRECSTAGVRTKYGMETP